MRKPGASINISERGTRGTVGIPGTGISYSENLSAHQPAAPQPPVQQDSARAGQWSVWVVIVVAMGIVAVKLLRKP